MPFKVNNCLPLKLWCSWHVAKAWQEEIPKKITDKTVQKQVYEKLHYLRDITDENVFDQYLSDFRNSLSLSGLYKSFADYFEKQWVKSKKHWAYCFRKGIGVNTNMHVEAFHRVLKYVYLDGKHNRRLDVCLLKLIKFSRDKVFDRASKQTKGKLTYKAELIFQKHKNGLALGHESARSVSEKIWMVKSEKSPSTEYKVEILNDKICVQDCKLKCSECFACSHTFSCECMDYLTKHIPCKHIHLVASMHNSKANKGSEATKVGNVKQENPLDSLDATLSFIESSKPITTDKLKDRINRSLLSLIEITKNVNDETALTQLDKHLTAAQNTFSALIKHKYEVIPITKKVNNNQKVQRQAKFFSTKKKNKPSKARLARPDEETKKELQDRSNWKNIKQGDFI